MPDLTLRTHTHCGMRSRAVYSPCERYRYGLERVWNQSAPVVFFIMLNPSTATELRNDPTIERCERRARAMGAGALRIGNLFGWRATDPRDLKRADAPVGEGNDTLLLDWHAQSDTTIAAWGVHGAYLDRHKAALDMLRAPLHHLGLTKAGFPRHPLYVAYATKLKEWTR